MGTEEASAAEAADDAATAGAAEDTTTVTYATGIDDFDVVVDVEGPAVDVEHHQLVAAERSLAVVLQQGGTLISAEAGGGAPLSDYDRDFAPLTHPTVFPYGEGGRPAEGMSENAYFRLVLERQSATGRGDNVGMLLTLFDVQSRPTPPTTTTTTTPTIP